MSKYVGKIITNQAPVSGNSVVFDGTGDWLSIADSAQFNLGTSNYTMEFWVYPTSFSSSLYPFSYQWSSQGGTRLILFAQNTNGTYLVYYYDAGNNFTSTNTVTLNAWNHIALVRNGNVFTLYINGVSGATATNAITYPDSPYPVYIGAFYNGSTGASPYVGYISNLRVVIGTAVYTINFTPSTVPLDAIPNTRLLTCKSPIIVDNSPNNFAITVNGNAAVSSFSPFPAYNAYNPAPTTANPLIPAPGVWTLDEALQYTQQGVWPSPAANAIEDVFSTYLYTGTGAAQSINNGIALGNSAANNSSISLNASTPSYLTFSSQVNLSGDFCIQAWVYPTSLTGTRLLFSSTSDTNVQMPRIQENGGIYCYVNGTEITSGAAASALQANVWTHLAMTRSGSTFRIFVNGVLYATATYSGTFNIGVLGVFFFSGSLFGTPYAFGGNISNAQIVSGNAVYTTDFTPPQNTLIGGSVLLGAGATPLADTSGTGKTVTQFGSPAASSSGPWAVGGNYGGLVWIKSRNTAGLSHSLIDTVRGQNKIVYSNLTNAEATSSAGTGLTSFNSNGFSLGPSYGEGTNSNGVTNVSWTFREQAKFFDVVTFTASAAAAYTFNHNLGSTPGFVIIKPTSVAGAWYCYHTSLGVNKYLLLNTTDASGTNPSGNWAATSTTFTVPTDFLSGGTQTYVAYLFAHDAGGFGAAGTDNVISCGSFSANANTTINLGWEPQFILWKNSQGSNNWGIADNMRGLDVSGTVALLNPSTTSAESSSASTISINSTGFTWIPSVSGNTYIYIAIRRGPMRPPLTSTSVFTPIKTGSGSTLSDSYASIGFPIDMTLRYQTGTNTSAIYKNVVFTRLLGINSGASDIPTSTNALKLLTPATDAASTSSIYYSQTGSMGLDYGGSWSAPNYVLTHLHFRRAPGFFDVVYYSGTGANRTISHNLTVPPEMMIIKRTNSVRSWSVYTASTTNSSYLYLNTTAAPVADATVWNNTTPTSTVFSLGTALDVNASGSNYIAYLFATVGGISKVGSYIGTGTTQQINCGFTNGSRFVMIKRVDTAGDWYVWDSARGIVAGNDPYLLLNSTADEVTGTDYVDTYSAGFELSSTASAALNASGGTYIFYAIA